MAHLDILEKQEELLQFDHFDYTDAYALGTCMVEYAKKNNIVIAVSIRMNDGCIVYQYCPEGTNLVNQIWMGRKYNTVQLTGKSSLRAALTLPEDHGLDKEQYAICGGGFPIRMKATGEVVGVVLSSNLHHIADHEFLVDSLREYLNCPEAPAYPFDPEKD